MSACVLLSRSALTIKQPVARRAAEAALAALGTPRDGRHVHISLGDAGPGGLAALDSHTGKLSAPSLDRMG